MSAPALDTRAAHRTLATAALVTIAVTVSGSALGLVRDVLLARFFGADGATDAFLVAWTVPETAFCLVVEGAMSLVMVPLFSRTLALTQSGPGGGPDGAGGPGGAVRDLVAATLPRTVAALAVAAAVVALGAPLLVRGIAPGLADPALAVTCTRLTAVTVLGFGVAGYLSAALRAHHVFAAPAAIHLAYNAGIIGLMWTLHGRLGVVSAAAGVAFGSLLMAAVQLPAFVRRVGLPRLGPVRLPRLGPVRLPRLGPVRLPRRRGSGPPRRRAVALPGGGVLAVATLAPVVVYTLGRQSQVYVERFLGSGLPAGAISHLNYAQKLAQLPMLVALLVCTVTFPALARAMAAGDLPLARRRLAADVRVVTLLVLLGAAYLFVFAPAVVQTLLERGAFAATDSAATAAIVRVYAVGLLGHAMVGVAIRPYFAAAGRAGSPPVWFPAAAMGAGLAVDAVLAVLTVGRFGVLGIAAANGAGIATAAALLLAGLRRRPAGGAGVVELGETVATAVRAFAAAAVAGLAGWLSGRWLEGLGPAVVSLAGGAVVLVTFVLVARALGFDELTAAVWRRVRRAR